MKVFKLIDDSTEVVVIAEKFNTSDKHTKAEKVLLREAGMESGANIVMLYNTVSHEFSLDPFKWGNRTLRDGHFYIRHNYGRLKSGETIDIRENGGM